MTCPYLEYRRRADDAERETAGPSRNDEVGASDLAFDEARAYCAAAERFVQPMRADVCNDRFELRHDEHCEIYLEHAASESDDSAGDGCDDGGDSAAEGNDGV
jgi:hypothetical protein